MTSHDVVTQARAWLGFQARANDSTPFGEMTGYNHQPVWSGLFVDYIFFKAGVRIPSCAHTGSGLAEFMKAYRVYQNPRPGDIVFFSFATGDKFNMPHCGLVVDTTGWKSAGLFKTIEGATGSGLPRGDQSVTGVYERVRSQHEVIGFARPKFRPAPEKKDVTGRLEIKLDSIRPGRRNKSIGLVQASLSSVTGLGRVTIDLYDDETQRAYARFQRSLGYVGPDANGLPDMRSLQALGDLSSNFRVIA